LLACLLKLNSWVQLKKCRRATTFTFPRNLRGPFTAVSYAKALSKRSSRKVWLASSLNNEILRFGPAYLESIYFWTEVPFVVVVVDVVVVAVAVAVAVVGWWGTNRIESANWQSQN